MRSLVHLSLAVLAVTFSYNVASAAQNSREVLADILSPDELATEMGFAVDEGASESAVVPVDGERLQILVDKSLQGTSETAQSMQIFLDGQLIHTLAVSTGREKDEIAKSGKVYFSRTPTGSFKITHRDRNHYSVTWQAPMKFAEFFVGGIAIHATAQEHYKDLGTRASGGCVRVTLEDAKMIWDLVDQVGADQVRITVFEK